MPANKFDRAAKRWEDIYQGTPLRDLPWEESRPSQELIELVESGKVEKGAALDVCCGSGNNVAYLAENDFDCYGIDISKTAIGYAREKVAAAGKTCELLIGNVLNLPYPNNIFTLVFDRGCFHSQLPAERKTYAASIFRVLKSGGKFLLLCFSSKDHVHGPPYGFSPQEIRLYFSEFFEIQRIKEFSAGGDGTKGYFLSVLMEKIERNPQKHGS